MSQEPETNNFFDTAFVSAAPVPAALQSLAEVAAIASAPRRATAVEKPVVHKADWQTNTVFFGNFPTNGNTKAFTRLLSVFGPVESVRVRSQQLADETVSGAKKSRVLGSTRSTDLVAADGAANAYVRFTTPEACAACLAGAPGRVIFEGRILSVDSASSGKSYRDFAAETGLPEEAGSAEYSSKRSVYFGNMPVEMNENDIWTFFETLVGGEVPELEGLSTVLEAEGHVRRVRLLRDRVTRRSHGRGFVEFAKRPDAAAAAAATGAEVGGRKVVISRVKEGAVRTRDVADAKKARKIERQLSAAGRRGAGAAAAKRGANARRPAAGAAGAAPKRPPMSGALKRLNAKPANKATKSIKKPAKK